MEKLFWIVLVGLGGILFLIMVFATSLRIRRPKTTATKQFGWLRWLLDHTEIKFSVKLSVSISLMTTVFLSQAAGSHLSDYHKLHGEVAALIHKVEYNATNFNSLERGVETLSRKVENNATKSR